MLKVPGNLKLATLSTALPFMYGGVSTSFFFSKKSVVCSFHFFCTFTVRLLPFHHTQPLHFLLLDRLIGLVDRLHCCKVTCTFDDSVGLLWLCRIPCTQGVKEGAQHPALWDSCAIHLTLAFLSKRP